MSVPGVRIPYPPQNYLLEDKRYNELGEGSSPLSTKHIQNVVVYCKAKLILS